MERDLLHPTLTPEQFREPRWAQFLFASSRAAWLWLVLRLYLAYVFLPAGWGKITGGKWLFGDGAPIQGLIGGAIASEDTPGWYVWFLQNIVQPNASLFATLVALGEFAVGLGLLVGLLTGIAAFGGRLPERQLRARGGARIQSSADHPRDVAGRRLAKCRLDRARSVPLAVGPRAFRPAAARAAAMIPTRTTSESQPSKES